MLANLSLHYGRLSLVTWEEMSFTAEGQLDFQPIPMAEVSELHTE